MKSILMSIKPKWIEKITSGEKTVEVRKTVPKCGAPFKVYMYCTFGRPLLMRSFYDGKSLFKFSGVSNKDAKVIYDEELWNGKVVGEFVCDGVRPFEVQSPAYWYLMNKASLEQACLTKEELHDYIGAGNLAYGLHISDLKIYDKPKELSEFNTLCIMPKEVNCENCPFYNWNETKCVFGRKVTRPPQSWQYVEEL